MTTPDFDKIAAGLIDTFKRAAFDRMMHEDGCPEGEQIKAGIAAIATAIYNAGLERAANIAQAQADRNEAKMDESPFWKQSPLRAARRVDALKIAQFILNDTAPCGNARRAIANEMLERAAIVAEGYGWAGRESTHCESYEEGRRDAADSIAGAIRSLKGDGK